MFSSENRATRDYYADLGIPTSATAKDIRFAYYRLARTHHPDRPGGETSEFRRVQEAYEFLSDPDKKAGYDRSRGRFGAVDNPRPPASGGGFEHWSSSGTQFDTGSVKAEPFVRTGQGKFAKSNYWDTHEPPLPK
jgi:curved DNA-binding protein CbpA